jgi:hypothetical protein
MPKFGSGCAIVNCLSERGYATVISACSTWIVEASTHESTGDEHCDILFRSCSMPHLDSYAFLELPFLDAPLVHESPTSVEIASTFLTSSWGPIFCSLLESAIYDVSLAQRFGRLIALAYFAANVAPRKRCRCRLAGRAGLLGKGTAYVGCGDNH